MAWVYNLTFALDAGSVALSDVAGFTCKYGKTAEAASYSAGVGTLELYNNDGKFTPGGGGTFTDENWVGKAFRLYVSDSEKVYAYGPSTVFAGVVEDIDLKIIDTKQSRLTVKIIDRLGQLSQMMLGDPDDSGGIVTAPTLAVIGEAGPEAVIPLGRAGGGMGGGPMTVNVYMPVGSDGDSVVRALQEYEARNGPVPVGTRSL